MSTIPTQTIKIIEDSLLNYNPDNNSYTEIGIDVNDLSKLLVRTEYLDPKTSKETLTFEEIFYDDIRTFRNMDSITAARGPIGFITAARGPIGLQTAARGPIGLHTAARGPIGLHTAAEQYPQLADQILQDAAEQYPTLCGKIDTPIWHDSITAARGPIGLKKELMEWYRGNYVHHVALFDNISNGGIYLSKFDLKPRYLKSGDTSKFMIGFSSNTDHISISDLNDLVTYMGQLKESNRIDETVTIRRYIIGIDDYIESFPRLKQMSIETEHMHKHLKDMNVLHDAIRELSKTSNSNSEIQVLCTKLNDMCNKCKSDIVLWELDV